MVGRATVINVLSRLESESPPKIRRKRRNERVHKEEEEQNSWENNIFVRGIKRMNFVGLKQALQPGIHFIQRLVWFMIFFICVFLALDLIYWALVEYMKRPIELVVLRDESISNIPTMTTTVCPARNNLLNSDLVSDTKKILDKTSNNETFIDESGITWVGLEAAKLLLAVDSVIKAGSRSSAKRSKLFKTKDESEELVEDLVKKTNITLKDDPLDPTLKDKVIPFLKQKTKTVNCSNILGACFWEGSEKNCTELFVPVQIDSGSCCTFNKIPDSVLKSGGGIMSSLNSHNFTRKETLAWQRYNIDELFEKQKTNQQKNKESYPKSQKVSGESSGLSFVLVYEESNDSKDNAYMIGVNSPFEKSKIPKNGVRVPSGFEVFIKTKAEVRLADPNIKQYDLSTRGCYSQEETFLRYFKHYTKDNCHEECMKDKLLENCSCVPVSMSDGQGERICGSKDSKCVQTFFEEFDKKGYDEMCPICLPSCNEIKYTRDVTYLPYTESSMDQNQSGNDTESKEPETSVVHIFFGSDEVPRKILTKRIPVSFLIGILGGILSLTLGFSLATAFNIFVGIGIILIHFLCPFWEEKDAVDEHEHDEVIVVTDEHDMRQLDNRVRPNNPFPQVQNENSNQPTLVFDESNNSQSNDGNESTDRNGDLNLYDIQGGSNVVNSFENAEIPGNPMDLNESQAGPSYLLKGNSSGWSELFENTEEEPLKEIDEANKEIDEVEAKEEETKQVEAVEDPEDEKGNLVINERDEAKEEEWEKELDELLQVLKV